MQRIFTLLLSLVLVSAFGWAQTTKTVVYHWSDGTTGSFDGSSKKNMLTFTDGAHIDLVGNAGKEYQNGLDIKVNGETFKTIKVSNGAQNKYYAPEGWKVSKVTLYSYVNYKPSEKGEGRVSYWKELGEHTYTAETGTILTNFSDNSDYQTNPDIVTEVMETPSTEFNFTNTGEQLCFVMEVVLVQDASKIQPILTWSEESCEVNINDETFALPTLTAEPAENAAEILAGVTYTSSNENVATIAADGIVTIKAHGTTIIKAAFEANDNYFGASASYTLIVVDPNIIDKIWNKDTWTKSKYTETTVVDGLTIYASSNKTVSGGSTLNLGGAASVDGDNGLTRAVSFDVPGKVKITYTAEGGSNRTLALAAGEWTEVIAMHPCTSKETKTFYYTGEATTLYMYSTSAGIKFHDIHVETIADDEAPVAPEVAHVGDELELDENGTLTINFDLTEGHKLYYVYTQNEEPAAAEAPQRSIIHGGKTYEESEGNSVTISGAAHLGGTLSYFALDPATGLRSTPVDVTVAPNRVVTGLTEISANAETKAEYFTIQGIRVAAPEAAGIYICRRGTEVSKIIVK